MDKITSRFTGVIKKLHYDSDDMAIVGKVWRGASSHEMSSAYLYSRWLTLTSKGVIAWKMQL